MAAGSPLRPPDPADDAEIEAFDGPVGEGDGGIFRQKRGKRDAGPWHGMAGGQDRVVRDGVRRLVEEFGVEGGAEPRGHRGHARGMAQRDVQDVVAREADLLVNRQEREFGTVEDGGVARAGRTVAVAVIAPERERA